MSDTWLRLTWANRDGRTFQRVSEWFSKEEAHTIHVQRQGDRWHATFRRLCEPAVEAEKLLQLARALGSFLDHSRAAINYSVYQLALLAIREDPSLDGSDLPSKDRLRPDTVEYPIVREQKMLKGHNGVRNLPDKYRRVINTKQPYYGQNEGLRLLNELAREYRHRVVHSAAIAPLGHLHYVIVNGVRTAAPDMDVLPHDRLEDGDEILNFSLPNVSADADVKPQVAIAVGIDHPLTRERDGVGVLNSIGAAVTAVLNETESTYFS